MTDFNYKENYEYDNYTDEGSKSISYVSSNSIYDCIYEACGVDVANEFFRRF